MPRLSLPEEIAVAEAVCRTIGLGAVEPTLVKAAHHTTLLLAPHPLVARIQSAEPVAAALARATRELAVTRHVADQSGLAVAPAGRAGPHVVGSAVLSLWPHVPHRPADDADAGTAAVALAALHRALRSYPVALPPFTLTLDRCEAVLADPATPLGPEDRTLLDMHHRRLRATVTLPGQAWVPLHGDIHLGNLLIADHGPVWVDHEDACLGPIEQDIAGLPPAAWPLFPAADPARVQAFADLKSVCVAIWCAADATRSAAVRDAAAYHLDRVRGFAT